MNVNDPKNEYYQPWQQDPVEQGPAAPRHDTGEGLSKPQDLPPVGMDLSRYADEEKLPREPLIDGEKLKENSAKLLQGAARAANHFATWTIKLGEKADIPNRFEKLEIPRKTKKLVRKSSAAAAEATRAAAQGTAKVSKVSAEKSAEVWKKAALADKMNKLSSEAGRGISEIADKTKSGLGQVAKASKETLSETAGKLRPVHREEEDLPPPPSGLEQLLEREAEAQAAETAKSTAELPLFSENAKAAEASSAATTEAEAPLAAAPESDSPVQDAPPVTNAPVVTPAPIAPTQQSPAPQAAEPKAAPASPAAAALTPAPDAPASPAAPAPAAAAPAAAKAQVATPPPQSPSQNQSAKSPAAAPEKAKVPPHHIVNHARSEAGHSASAPSAAPTLWRPSGAVIGMAAFGLAALLGASFYLGSQFGGGLSKGDVETIVGDYITTNPQIIPAALEAQRGREMAAAIDSVRPVLEKPYAGAWGGNANGDVTLVVFTDYACGFCRASVPDIDRLIREDRRLKVVYRELPIISRESRNAALMALLAARQGKYDAFHHAMFEQSSLSPSAIISAAEKAEVTLDGDSEAEEAVFQRELESNLAIATELQLNATPTWVIGDQLLQGQVGYAALQDAVAKARAKKSS